MAGPVFLIRASPARTYGDGMDIVAVVIALVAFALLLALVEGLDRI